MRTIVVAALALAACKGNVETKKVDKLDLKSFTIAVPAGWNEITDARLTGKMAPGSHTLTPAKPPEGFTPSIYIQELEMSPTDHATISGATDDFCKNTFLKAMADLTKTDASSAKAVDYHGLKGCEAWMSDPKTPQAARQITLSNGKIGISVTCNRDKKAQGEAEAGCNAILDAITPKS